MSLSLGSGLITCQRYPGDQRSDAQIYAEALDLAEQAEALGLDSAWVSEHHFANEVAPLTRDLAGNNGG